MNTLVVTLFVLAVAVFVLWHASRRERGGGAPGSTNSSDAAGAGSPGGCGDGACGGDGGGD